MLILFWFMSFWLYILCLICFFCIKIRQCDYCLDSFVCSFMVAPCVGGMCWEMIWGRFWGEKTLSVKVSINKEDFGIVGRFLVGWGFDFWVVKWLKCLILVGFDDMGYDNIFIWIKIEFCLILVGFWRYRQGKILKKVCGWISYRVCCISSPIS